MDVEQYIKVVTYSILAIVIVFINLVSLVIIFWSKKLLSKPQVVLIVNLIVTHLIQGSVVMPIYAVRKSRDYPIAHYPIVCDTWRLTYMLTFYGTCMNVLLIALDRFIATRYYMKYTGQYKHTHFLAAVGINWLYVVTLCLVPFIPLKKAALVKKPFYCNYNQPAEWTSFMLIFNTVVPYVAIILIYVYITRQIGESSNAVYKHRGDSELSSSVDTRSSIIQNKPRVKTKQYRDVNKLTFRIIFIYGVTWAPSIVYYSIVTMTPEVFSTSYYVSQEEMLITFIIKYITFFNAATAPVLYCYNHAEFRREAKRFFSKIRAFNTKQLYELR